MALYYLSSLSDDIPMRTFIFVLVGLFLIFGSLHLFRDFLRPPREANLMLHTLNDDTARSELQKRLAEINFNCSDDARLGYGTQACFAPVKKVDELQANYLALYFAADDTLSAVNIVLDSKDYANSIDYLKRQFGENNFKKVIDENQWLIWQRNKADAGIIMAHNQGEQKMSPSVMWFRDTELAERLLSNKEQVSSKDQVSNKKQASSKEQASKQQKAANNNQAEDLQ